MKQSNISIAVGNIINYFQFHQKESIKIKKIEDSLFGSFYIHFTSKKKKLSYVVVRISNHKAPKKYGVDLDIIFQCNENAKSITLGAIKLICKRFNLTPIGLEEYRLSNPKRRRNSRNRILKNKFHLLGIMFKKGYLKKIDINNQNKLAEN